MYSKERIDSILKDLGQSLKQENIDRLLRAEGIYYEMKDADNRARISKQKTKLQEGFRLLESSLESVKRLQQWFVNLDPTTRRRIASNIVIPYDEYLTPPDIKIDKIRKWERLKRLENNLSIAHSLIYRDSIQVKKAITASLKEIEQKEQALSVKETKPKKYAAKVLCSELYGIYWDETGEKPARITDEGKPTGQVYFFVKAFAQDIDPEIKDSTVDNHIKNFIKDSH